MNKENASKLWKIIQEAGDYLICKNTKLHGVVIMKCNTRDPLPLIYFSHFLDLIK